jgi:predicted phosphate transport protein (TIGR00153 family)
VAFPRETEEQIKRIVLDICQDHVRKVLDCVRELTLMIENFTTNTKPRQIEEHLSKIRKFKEETTEVKKGLLVELAEAGVLLLNREDFLRLVDQITEIADASEGIAFRVNHMNRLKLELDSTMRKNLLNLAKNTLKTVTSLRETILALTYDRTKALDMARNVDLAEYAVDDLWRDIEMRIISLKSDVPTILLLKDIAQMLEDIADKSEDAANTARILAIGI